MATFDDARQGAVDLDVLGETGGFAEEVEDTDSVRGCVGSGEWVACYPY